jgi:hypothetical protein
VSQGLLAPPTVSDSVCAAARRLAPGCCRGAQRMWWCRAASAHLVSQHLVHHAQDHCLVDPLGKAQMHACTLAHKLHVHICVSCRCIQSRQLLLHCYQTVGSMPFTIPAGDAAVAWRVHALPPPSAASTFSVLGGYSPPLEAQAAAALHVLIWWQDGNAC